MANLSNISFIQLYTNPTGDMVSTAEARNILKEHGIKFEELSFVEGPYTLALFSALSSWCWGRSAEYIVVNQLPFVIWKEYYDDGMVVDRIALGLDQMRACDLLTNKSLITREEQ